MTNCYNWTDSLPILNESSQVHSYTQNILRKFIHIDVRHQKGVVKWCQRSNTTVWKSARHITTERMQEIVNSIAD